MRHANTLPEPESFDNEAFHIYARREVVGVLQDITDRRALVTLYFKDGERFIVTNLLNVNPEFEEVIFDTAQDESANRAISSSRRLTFVTFIEHIKTQFSAQRAEHTNFEGRPALRIRLPESVMRLQRRSFFRVSTPKGAPLVCRVPLSDGSTVAFNISDLSVGGLAMLAGPTAPQLTPGTVFDDCRIELPEHGLITTSLELRNRYEAVKSGRDESHVRYGCRFLNIGGAVENLIQRYINHLERARRALS